MDNTDTVSDSYKCTMSAKESDTEEYTVRNVVLGGRLINPVLINIDYSSLTNEEINNCKECSWIPSEDDENARNVRLVSNEDAIYEGTAEIKTNPTSNLLIIRNKWTKEITLVHVSECQLARVLPKPELRTDYDNDEIQTTYEENKSNLVKAFGSKKSKRNSGIGSKMKINSDITTTQMMQTASGVQVDPMELELVDNFVDSCVPVCHRDASDPSEVYLLEDFLSEREFNSMSDEAFTVFHLMPFTQQESGYSQFLIDTIDCLQNKATEDRIKVLLYIDSLMKFLALDLKNKTRKQIAEIICPFSHLIAKKIIDEFSHDTINGRIRNVTMDDKIAIYIIILVLIVCDNSCNIEELSKYLPKFSVSKLGRMARALCLSTKNKINWSIKVPLPPLKSKYMRKRKQ